MVLDGGRLWRGELDCQPALNAQGSRLSDYVRSRMCIDPLVAAILMPWSSLTVVLISWRSRTFGRNAPWA